MDTFLQMNPKIVKMFPILHKTKSRQKAFTIVCRLQEKRSNFYQVLSLQSNNVGFDEIKKAYRNMALQYHPDVCLSSAKEESTKRFVELQEAYETLSDPISRRIYDCELGFVPSVEIGFEVTRKQGKVVSPRKYGKTNLMD